MPVTHKLSDEATSAIHAALANLVGTSAHYGVSAAVTLTPSGDKPVSTPQPAF